VNVFGSITNGDTVRLERDFAPTPDELWAYLTTPEGLSRWIAEGHIGPEHAELRFLDNGSEITGVVTTWSPPNVVEFEWGGGPTQPAGSRVRFELFAEGTRTRLVLTHSRSTIAAAPDIAAGWHLHLDTLGFLADGLEPPLDRSAWSELHEHYQRLDNQP
jgi:uncharacterized protein YndB with AHSA1/START domain